MSGPTPPNPAGPGTALSCPWARRPGERPGAFGAFEAYCELGERRTLAAVADRLGKSPSLVRRWAARWEWAERARLRDNHEADVARAARDGVVAATAASWESRRQAEHEDLYTLGRELRAKARAMLDVPITTEVSEDGQTVVKPGPWTFATANQMAKTSAELVGLSIDAAINGDDDSFDPLTATPEECRAYVDRMNGRRKAARNALSGA